MENRADMIGDPGADPARRPFDFPFGVSPASILPSRPRVMERKRVRDFSRAFGMHFHPELSIALVSRGRSVAFIGGARRTVRGGDLVIIPPFLPHCCNPDRSGDWSYELLLLAGAEPRGVQRSAPSVFPSCRVCRSLFEDIGGAGDPSPLLAHLEAQHGWPSDAALRGSRRSRRKGLDAAANAAAARLAAEVEEPPRVAELAREAGVDAPTFVRVFRRLYGMPPHAWALICRIQRAKELLRDGVAVADAAAASGFADQSHLSRNFVRFVGVTPAAWARGNGV